MRFIVSFVFLICFVTSSALAQSSSTSVMDRPEVKAMLAARMAKIRILSSDEFERAVKRGVSQLDKGLASMSKKDTKRLAKLGEAIWADCAVYAEYGAKRAKVKSDSDKKSLGNYNDNRLRKRLFEHLKSTLSSHNSYKMNSKLDIGNARNEENADLLMAMGGLKCQLDMNERKLSGKFEHAYEFYVTGISAADVYRPESKND